MHLSVVALFLAAAAPALAGRPRACFTSECEGLESRDLHADPTRRSTSSNLTELPSLLARDLLTTPPAGAVALNIDFTKATGTAQKFLAKNNIHINTNLIGSTPLAHKFKATNVVLKNGALQLIVRGQSGKGTTSSAEIETKFEMLYGSITTRARISKVPGVCSSSFFYKSDNSEIDIEFLSSNLFKDSPNVGIFKGIQYTNQALVPGTDATSTAVAPPFDPTMAFHDYTIVWEQGRSSFYADGQLQTSFDTNVPTTAGPWIWNNWSSGDKYWSAGPPTKDNIFEIQSITGYYFPA